jgi:hypothetical protein
MAIQRLRCEWAGSAVEGPGLTTFYAEADGTLAIQVGAAGFFEAIEQLIPSGTTITIPAGGDVLDEATGELTGAWGGGAPTTITTSGSGTFAGGVGARVVWQTNAVRAGRRVRGSTFVVPLIGSAYDPQGTPGPETLTALQTAIADFMVQVPDQAVVWSRPRDGVPGVASVITGGTAPDRISWLRSRRT